MTSKLGDMHDYLGIKWDFTVPGQVSLSMEGYLADIFACCNVTTTYPNPATEKLFVVNSSSPLLIREKREHYHSIVMTLHYLAKRTRSNILTTCTFMYMI